MVRIPKEVLILHQPPNFQEGCFEAILTKKTPVGVKHSSGLALWPFSCGKQPMLNEGFQKEDALFVNLGEKN
jgi:hypothetical protein